MKKIKIKSIENEITILKPFSKKFISAEYLGWLNDKQVSRYILKAKENTSFDDLKLFTTKMIESPYNYFFAILYKKNFAHIGNVRIGPIDFNSLESGFGILIGNKNFHNVGIGFEVMNAVKDFSFNYLKLKKLNFLSVKNHVASKNLYIKSGFECLGDAKKTFDKNGKSLKLIQWTINNPHFK